MAPVAMFLKNRTDVRGKVYLRHIGFQGTQGKQYDPYNTQDMGNKNIHAEDIMPECSNLSTQVPGERNVLMLRFFFVSFCS